MDVDVSAVRRREPGMEPFEVMTSASQERLMANIATAKRFAPLAEEEVARILAKCAEAARDGQFEPYKKRELA